MAGRPRIQVLPVDVANRIAAGEVVERPASVLKELVENSLDAGARRVQVDVDDGGRRRIRVVDDGHGMSLEEARLALQRHATSKIRTAEDLERIRSLGFRGEALPSIAAVSRMEIVTREPEAAFAWRLRVEGGKVLSEDRAAAPPGTSVTVEDLFFNTPARRKHLRQPTTELARALDVMHGLALAHPGVAFQVRHGGRLLLQTSGDGDLRSALAAVLGPSVAGEVLSDVDAPPGPDPAYRLLEAHVGRPSAARASRHLQFFILNGRSVRSDALRQALERPFRRLLPLHRYPVAVVRLDIDPAEVDVNVHPSKEEVRLAREREVARALGRMVSRLLAQADLTPRIRLTPPTGGAEAAAALQQALDGLPAGQIPVAGPHPGRAPAPGGLAEPAGAYGRGGRFTALRLLGQVDRTYLVAEGPEGLYLVDQHAAHERVVFEQLLGKAASGPAPRQALAVPIPVEVGEQGIARWQLHRHRLARHGFVAEAFGPGTLLLREVPVLYRRPADAAVFRDLLDALGDGDPGDAELEADLAQRTTAACRSAVKAHDPLSLDESRRLLELLDDCSNPYTCPHGRPTLLLITLRELERHFKRTL